MQVVRPFGMLVTTYKALHGAITQITIIYGFAIWLDI